MMKISLLTILLITGVFAQELEVEGSLKVIGEIDAQGNAITNVGNPTQDNDAVNLSTVRDMSGMKPERIYTHHNYPFGMDFSFTVPDGKVWKIITSATDSPSIAINGSPVDFWTTNEGGNDVWVLPNSTISNYEETAEFYFTIFEYPISGSGTDQGMDYIEP